MNEPATLDGWEAWQLAEACLGQVRRAGMNGAACGFDMPAILAVAQARRLDPETMALLIPGIEAGMVIGMSKKSEGEDVEQS